MKHAVQDDLKISSRIVMLKPGMHIFRYASNFTGDEKVLLTLHPAPLGKGAVDFFPGDGVSRNTLCRLGDCMIVRIKGDQASVLVTQYHLEKAGSAAPTVDLRVDYIDTSEKFLLSKGQRSPMPTSSKAPAEETFFSRPAPAEEAVIPRPAPAEETIFPRPAPATDDWLSAPSESLELFGHVERVGDVRVTDNWLGNPAGTARLEGFAVQWKNRPPDVDLVYTCQVEGAGQMSPVFSGNYAGTRQQAKAITALALTLAGPRAADFELSGQVAFAGFPPVGIVPGQKLSGSRGSEPLVALRVQITRKGGETAVSRSPSASPWDDPRITQIFRANR